MDKLFLQILNMSLLSSYIICFLILIRFFLKKAPKIFSYGLWIIPFFRLIVPLSFESIFSLLPLNTRAIPQDIIYSQTPQIQSGIGLIDQSVNRILPGPTNMAASINPIQIWIGLGSAIWMVGIFFLLTYSIFTTIRFRRSLKSANLLSNNIYEIDRIKTAFVFGLINPRIYLPGRLSKNERFYIIKHEETHIRRRDHIIKFLAYMITVIHWFNPLVWLAYHLMGEDMELSCDEAVIREMGYGIKKDYSSSLLALSTGKRILGGSPLAFGENKTRSRIRNILDYRRPKLWVSLLILLISLGLALGFLTNLPKYGQTNIVDELRHSMAFISKIELDKDLVYLDQIEFVTENDEKRIEELDIDLEDMPNGFYIYDQGFDTLVMELTEVTEFYILDADEFNFQSGHKIVTRAEFIEYNEGLNYSSLYSVDIQDGHLVNIKEYYLP